MVLKIFRLAGDLHVDITPRLNEDLFKVNEFQHFINAINNDTEPNVSILEQNAAMMEIIDGIYTSSDMCKQIIFD